MYIENKENVGKEMKGSAIILILTGLAGIIALVLHATNVVSFLPENMVSPLFYVIMGGLFAIFFISGIMSISTSKRMVERGIKETSLATEIQKWFSENYTAKKIDTSLDFSEASSEEQYLMRTEKIQTIITSQFEDIDSEFAQNLADKFYSNLYE